jgi:hypothetical protein
MLRSGGGGPPPCSSPWCSGALHRLRGPIRG